MCVNSRVNSLLITFRVSRRRREMYSGHARLSACLSVRGRMPTLLHGPDVAWGIVGMVAGARSWADLQLVHGLRCHGNIARTRNVSECLYSFYAWFRIIIPANEAGALSETGVRQSVRLSYAF